MTDWTFSLSSKILIGILAALTILSSWALLAQGPIDPALKLSELERTKVELIHTKIMNVQLQFASLQQQMENLRQAHGKLLEEEKNVMNETAKAHGVEMTKYRLNESSTAFEPIPESKVKNESKSNR